MRTEDMEVRGLSRRDFLKGGAIVAAGVASAAGIVACTPAKTEEVKASEAGTGTGISAGAENGKYLWETPPAPIADADIKETYETEICVVGAGNSGIVAALTAAEEGAKVLVLQNLPEVHTQGTGASAYNSQAQISAGLATDYRADLTRLKASMEGGLINYDMLNLWFENSGETIDWVSEKGGNKISASFDKIPNWSEADDWCKTFPISSKYSGEAGTGCAALISVLAPMAEELGAEFVYNVTAEQLVREDNNSGRVTAVIGKNADGSYIKVTATKGIIICTGGYEANMEMRQKWLPQAMKFDNISENKGEGILMGMWVGGAIDPAPHASNIHYDYGGGAWGSGVPWLRVDTTGRRLGNEDISYSFLPFLDTRSDEAICFQIFDSEFDKYYPKMIENGAGLFRSFPPVEAKASSVELTTTEDTSSWSPMKKVYESHVAAGLAFKGETLSELAQQAGIDGEGLSKTVDRYNQLYDLGEDTDFGKKFSRMAAVRVPPFYAVKRKACVLGTLGGLTVNTKLQVLDTEGKVIPGLYAAGNASGGQFFGAPVQAMCAPASTISRAQTWGRLAAKNIIANE